MTASYRTKPTDEELLAALRDADPTTAAEAATVLGLRGNERASDALHELLRHHDPAAREAAAEALGLLGLESSIPALQCACKDPEPEVATAASLALQRLGVEECAQTACDNLILELSAADGERRALAARALGGLSECGAVDALVRALRDESAQVRADAAASLGLIGEPRVLTDLMSVGFTDPDEGVRKVAMHAVARLVVPETPL